MKVLNHITKLIAIASAIYLPACTQSNIVEPIVEPAPMVVEAKTPAPLPEYCFPEYQRLTLDTFNLCFRDGMSYVEVANVVGNRGIFQGQTKNMKSYQWSGTGNNNSIGGLAHIVFVDDRLVVKTQVNLMPDSQNCNFSGCLDY